MKTICNNADLVVREVDLPERVHGCIELDEEGRANIYLNRRDPEERKKRTLKHEIFHSVCGDHYIPELAAERLNRTRTKENLVLIY